jgi:hypothetical protein
MDVSTDATLGLLMKQALLLVLISCFALPACTSARLSHDEARKKIAAIGQSTLVPDAIEVRRIVSQSDTTAIAESTVTLAFQFERPNTNAEWHIESVRLGDRDWVKLDELIAAMNEGRRRTTVQTLQQLAEGVEKYRSTNGTLPAAGEIVSLTDALYPGYLKTLVREDGWGNPIIYETMGNAGFRLVSLGADGRRGTPDDVVIENNRSSAP